jgi:hypothetical protein
MPSLTSGEKTTLLRRERLNGCISFESQFYNLRHAFDELYLS